MTGAAAVIPPCGNWGVTSHSSVLDRVGWESKCVGESVSENVRVSVSENVRVRVRVRQ